MFEQGAVGKYIFGGPFHSFMALTATRPAVRAATGAVPQEEMR